MTDNNHGERIARLEQAVSDHERVCADRYADIKAEQAAATELLRQLNANMHAGVGAARVFKWLVIVGGGLLGIAAAFKGLK